MDESFKKTGSGNGRVFFVKPRFRPEGTRHIPLTHNFTNALSSQAMRKAAYPTWAEDDGTLHEKETKT